MGEIVTAGQAIESMQKYGVQVSTVGLKFTRPLKLDEGKECFNGLVKFHDDSGTFEKFSVGDIYNHLDRNHGTKIEQILDSWGEGHYWQFASCARVARIFPVNSRVAGVPWSVYETLAAKYVPENVRFEWLKRCDLALKAKKKIPRSELRQAIEKYKPVKEKSKDEDLTELKICAGTNPDTRAASTDSTAAAGIDRSNTSIAQQESAKGGEADDEMHVSRQSNVSSEELSDTRLSATAGGIGEGVRGEVEGVISEEPNADWEEIAKSAWDTCDNLEASRAKLEGFFKRVVAQRDESDRQCEIARQNSAAAERHNSQLIIENSSLRERVGTLESKLAGIWETAVELEEDDLKALDAIVKYRRSKFPKDDFINRGSEAGSAIRRRWQEIQRSR